MQALREAAPETVVVVHDGVRTTLSGVVWGNASESYPGHWIVHLEWNGQSHYGESHSARRRREEFRKCDPVKAAQYRAAEIKERLANGGF